MIISRFHPRSALRRFGQDKSGVAAVEFGLIAPIALVMMLGLIECGRALVMSRRFNLVTSVASDLVARSQTMSAADLDGIATAVQTIWQPYDASALNFTVLQIRSPTAGSTKKTLNETYVDWGRQYVWNGTAFQGTTLPDSCPDMTISTAKIIADGGSTILVQANYTFTPLFTRTALTSSIMPAATWAWAASSTHVPRQLCVDFRNGNSACQAPCE